MTYEIQGLTENGWCVLDDGYIGLARARAAVARELGLPLSDVSDKLGELLGDGTIRIMESEDDFGRAADKQMDEMDEVLNAGCYGTMGSEDA